jgi:hypothetical protein
MDFRDKKDTLIITGILGFSRDRIAHRRHGTYKSGEVFIETENFSLYSGFSWGERFERRGNGRI